MANNNSLSGRLLSVIKVLPENVALDTGSSFQQVIRQNHEALDTLGQQLHEAGPACLASAIDSLIILFSERAVRPDDAAYEALLQRNW